MTIQELNLSQEEHALLVLVRHEKKKQECRRKLAGDEQLKALMASLYKNRKQH